MIDYTLYTVNTAPEEAQPYLKGIQEGFGFIPNIFAYMAEAPTTIEAYLALDAIVEKTSLIPSQQQIALLTVSVENECEFCTVAHRAVGKMKNATQQTLDAVYRKEPIENAADAALVQFIRTIVQNRGHLSDDDIKSFLNAGFNKQQILELMIITSIKTLSNYINHVTHPEPNKELLAMV